MEIIGLEAVLKLPNEPPTDVLTPHRNVQVHVTMTDERCRLDEKSKKNEERLRTGVKMTKKEKKAWDDENRIYDAFWPFEAPELSDLVKNKERNDIN